MAYKGKEKGHEGHGAHEGHGVKVSLQKPAMHASFELPKATVELLGKEGFKVQLERLRTENLNDQGHMMVSNGQGCISSPTGPTC